jgi:4-diphosphocytidyl-2-C-methyl-D-erythritol kinase
MPTDLYTAPSKINLGLEVVRRRSDGYHDINTVFYRLLEPRDTIRVEQTDIFQLTCSDSSLPSDARNLMMQAAHAYSEAAGCSIPSIHVHLEKQIPMGAGLGGGSSDAATMLQIIRDHAEVVLDPEEVLKIAVRLGADVPFFLTQRLAAIGTGLGEVLTPVDLEISMSILVVKDPTIYVSTKEAYDGVVPNVNLVHDFSSLFESELSLEEMRSELRNDFEPTVFARHPRLDRIKHDMYERGSGFALMSGSGSSIYGLFEDPASAQEASLDFESEGLLTFVNHGKA